MHNVDISCLEDNWIKNKTGYISASSECDVTDYNTSGLWNFHPCVWIPSVYVNSDFINQLFRLVKIDQSAFTVRLRRLPAVGGSSLRRPSDRAEGFPHAHTHTDNNCQLGWLSVRLPLACSPVFIGLLQQHIKEKPISNHGNRTLK